jgi:hypothetical protein
MEMVAPGGHFIGFTAGNNFFGHGFYQFSADLLFRVFDRENGFELQEMLLYEDSPGAKWFNVADPAVVRERVTLVNSRRTFLAVIAKKVETVPIFRRTPQQSDYSAGWRWKTGPSPTVRAWTPPPRLKWLFTRIRKRLFPYDKKHFRRLDRP